MRRHHTCGTLLAMPIGNDTNLNVTPGDATPRDTSHYTLTVEAASELFALGGVPRSVRSVQRYCRKGHLECITFDTEIGEKYLITRESVDRRVQELQQIERIQGGDISDAVRRDETRHDAPSRDTSRHDAPRNDSPDASEKVRELESKVRMLEIDKAVREQLLDRMNADREQLLGQLKGYVGELISQSRTIGKLETQLELSAGDRPRRVPVIPEQPRDADIQGGDNFNGSTLHDTVE